MIPVDLRELVDGFVSESLDNLDDNEIIISKLGDDNNTENLESIFRVFHTLKGLSGFFELYVIQKVTHTAETLLDLIRSNPMPLPPDYIDLLYVVFDFLQNSLKSVAENYTDELFKEESFIILEQVEAKIADFNKLIGSEDEEFEEEEEEETEDEAGDDYDENDHDSIKEFVIEFFSQVKDFTNTFSSLIEELKTKYSENAISTIFDAVSKFKAQSNLLELNSMLNLLKSLESLLEVYKKNQKNFSDKTVKVLMDLVDFLNSASQEEDIRNLESIYKAQLEKITQDLKDETHQPVKKSAKKKVKSAEPQADPHQILSGIEEELSKIEISDDTEPVKILITHLNLLAALKEVQTNSEMNDVIMSISTILESVVDGDISASAIIHVIRSDIKILTSFIRANLVKEEAVSAKEEKNEPVKLVEKLKEVSLESAQDKAENKTMKEFIKPQEQEKQAAPGSTERKEVRVSTEKLNKLFDLVGEIITMESMVVNNKNLDGLKLPDFQIAANMLNKLVRELQKITMSIRMIPLDGLFNKMSRLVRDLSRKFEKSVELEIYGADTEMDKNVIEQLSDPLVHMIRNCIDHGIEDEFARLDRGKSTTGKVILGASYQGNEIHITVEDDGAGLNRQKILEKAIAKGLCSTNPEELTDKQVWQFIFHAGLSTAQKVTDVSGRGVGMDVVKKNIEKLRGNIDIDSKTGFGTKITFRIPLTLAIMDAMLIRVGVSKYAIPILSVRESFQPKLSDITQTMDGIEVVKVRSELYPVVRLHEIFRKEPDNYELDKGILMMINSNSKKVCLFVDEILGQQQAVVKPLSEYIGEVQGLTGCMVMADGKIGLILDIDSLIEKAENFIK